MTIMREFIIADNQDITKAGMMFLLSRQKDTALAAGSRQQSGTHTTVTAAPRSGGNTGLYLV